MVKFEHEVEMVPEEMVLITREEYEKLKNVEMLMIFFELHGVDQWDNYDEAYDDYDDVLKAQEELEEENRIKQLEIFHEEGGNLVEDEKEEEVIVVNEPLTW
jgi:hypothetical protein